jgi:hypothetical protein
MKELDQIIREIELKKFTLAYPKKISKEDAKHPIWKKIAKGYQSDNHFTNLLAAVLCSAINQGRVYFKICYRELTKSIIPNDPQFQKYKRRKNAGLKKVRYSQFLKYLRESGLFDFKERTENCWGNGVQIVEIIDKDIIDFMAELARHENSNFVESDWRKQQIDEIDDFFDRSVERKQELDVARENANKEKEERFQEKLKRFGERAKRKEYIKKSNAKMSNEDDFNVAIDRAD